MALTDDEIMMYMDDYEMIEMMDDFENMSSLSQYASCFRELPIHTILGTVKLTVAGPQSQIPGSINIVTDEWCGRIVDGQFIPSKKVSPDVIRTITISLREYAKTIIMYKSEGIRRIHTMLDRVGGDLERPCIHFREFDACLSPSAHLVYVGPSGFILRDGTFITRSSSSRSEIELLENFGQQPAKCAREYGRITGKCCFCHRGLTDDKSTRVGYGPTCAKRYHLPY